MGVGAVHPKHQEEEETSPNRNQRTIGPVNGHLKLPMFLLSS